ncbi:SGNH/GDSL hydrolase family protein [Kiritimatiellota bacterium B12222]|nr:SGNH/GDSL hydrolase family protein [Kiritimatiellota bacterium B12222]
MTKKKEYDWYDVRDFGVEGKGWTDTECYFDRLPARAKTLLPEHLWNLSRSATGMSVRFETDAPCIDARWTLRSSPLNPPNFPRTAYSGLDLYIQDEGTWKWAGATTEFDSEHAEDNFINEIPAVPHTCHVNLPLRNPVDALSIGVPKGCSFTPIAPRTQAPIVYYGTSIVHGAFASRPGMAHAAILARWLDRPMINLGFSGSAKMEIEIATLLAELSPSLFIIDPLPNMDAALVDERAELFLRTLRDAHPTVPMVTVEDRTNTNAWIRPQLMAGHEAKRKVWRKLIQKLLDEGHDLYPLQADGLFGDDHEASPDSSHPTDLGCMRMAEKMYPVLKQACHP